MISVLIIEDQWVWASAVAHALEREGGIRHAHIASGVDEGLRIATSMKPDVALVDLFLDHDSGLRFARTAGTRGLTPRVAMMSIEPNAWAVQQARAAGVAGFIHKDDLKSPPVLVGMVRALANGQQVFTERVSARPLIDEAGLTDRELELMRCLSVGMGTEQIADHLSVVPQSVRNIIGRIGAKLGVSGRVEIIAWFTAAAGPANGGSRRIT